MSDFTIAGRTFASRLIVGTGKYPSPTVMAQAHEASGADMVTVAVRRVNISDRSKESLLDFIDMVTVGPNLRLDEIMIQDGSPLIGISVDNACASYTGVTILAHKREAEVQLAAPPDGAALLAAGDLVVAFGPREALEALEA